MATGYLKIFAIMATEPTEEQKTIATLTAQVETLTAAKTDADTAISKLTAAKAEADAQVSKLTTAGLEAQKQIQTLTNAKADSDKQLDAATKVVVDLKTQLSEKQTGVVELPKVKIGKDFYELVGGDFTFEAKEVTLNVLKEDQVLAARLVKEKVGNLRLIEK